MKRVFIANFGRENYEWPNCLRRSTVATMNAEKTHHFWVSGDRESFIETTLKYEKTARGMVPTPGVASRWFNLMTIIAQTSGDIWIHREKNDLWWTESLPDAPDFELGEDISGKSPKSVYVCHKPCKPWANVSLSGSRLEWSALHPKAWDFLSTEATLQELSPDYAGYALTLVRGNELTPWHERREWREKMAMRKAGLVSSFSNLKVTAYRMARTAWQTTQHCNGQEVVRLAKNKDFGFADEEELQLYIEELYHMQEGLCALTGIPMQLDRAQDDDEQLCSLDRIDSNGHYALGNLQIICRFANRWKSNGNNTDFMRLIHLIRSTSNL